MHPCVCPCSFTSIHLFVQVPIFSCNSFMYFFPDNKGESSSDNPLHPVSKRKSITAHILLSRRRMTSLTVYTCMYSICTRYTTSIQWWPSSAASTTPRYNGCPTRGRKWRRWTGRCTRWDLELANSSVHRHTKLLLLISTCPITTDMSVSDAWNSNHRLQPTRWVGASHAHCCVEEAFPDNDVKWRTGNACWR